jgi:phosphotransferase system HPr-like phosphotransfer protein
VVSIKQSKASKVPAIASISVKKGKSVTAKSLMKKAKIKAKKGDKLGISIVGSKTNGVKDTGKTLKFKSKGTYFAKVSVIRKNGSSTSRVFKVVVK